jgi:hypothetical protein
MIRPQSLAHQGKQQQGKAQMKTILMLIVGLMLADCGSMENHVRNRDEGARRSVSYINRSGTTAKLARWTRYALALDD